MGQDDREIVAPIGNQAMQANDPSAAYSIFGVQLPSDVAVCWCCGRLKEATKVRVRHPSCQQITIVHAEGGCSDTTRLAGNGLQRIVGACICVLAYVFMHERSTYVSL